MSECGARKRTALGWDAHCSLDDGHASDVHESADFAWQDASPRAWLKCGERLLAEHCYEPQGHTGTDHQSPRYIWSYKPFVSSNGPGRNVFARADRKQPGQMRSLRDRD